MEKVPKDGAVVGVNEHCSLSDGKLRFYFCEPNSIFEFDLPPDVSNASGFNTFATVVKAWPIATIRCLVSSQTFQVSLFIPSSAEYW